MALKRTSQFEKRKKDHIRFSLDEHSQAFGQNGVDSISLVHEALPEINFKDIFLDTISLNSNLKSPFFVSSMTAGHDQSVELNTTLAKACEKHFWWMGVGSQSRQLFDIDAGKEWDQVRKAAPSVSLMGNIGVSQLIQTPVEDIKKLCEQIQSTAMIVHLNPLQECLQQEGTPNFKGGLCAIENLCKNLEQPVVVKETGCGMSISTMKKLDQAGVGAIDVSGFGGTHWGRIEQMRNQSQIAIGNEIQGANSSEVNSEAGLSFYDWGTSTLDSLLQAREAELSCEVWASGGVRNGVEAYKLLALGATRVGLAKPILQAALKGVEALDTKIKVLEQELKIAMFCTGVDSLKDLKNKLVWKWKRN